MSTPPPNIRPTRASRPDPDRSTGATDRPDRPGADAAPPAPAEAGRRLIHVAVSVGAAIVAWFLPPALARATLAAAAAIAVATDLVRRRDGAFGHAFDRAVGSMLRPYERRRWTGATRLAVAFAAAAWLVPPPTAGVAFLIAGLADPAAAAFGRRFGRFRTPWGKSVAGSAAFVLAGTALVIALPHLATAPAVAAVLASALVEAMPIDDNLGVPITAALSLHLLGAVG